MIHSSLESAYQLLESSIIYYDGKAVGTVASRDPNAPAENYSDCFVRDFVPSALVFLLDGRSDIVRNFLRLTLRIRDMQEEIEGHRMLPRIMPASFHVCLGSDGEEEIAADFGDRAIGRVAPVDSMMWWVLLVYYYYRITGDDELVNATETQRGIRTILNIFLHDRFEVFPTLLVPDGSFMIDRRMGVYGHPLEIQSLFYGTLHAGCELLRKDEPVNRHIIESSLKRLNSLYNYIYDYYWLDFERLNEIHRFHTEEFGHDTCNQLNVYPDSIPPWVLEWLPEDRGYLVGNLGPGRVDMRFFTLGNLLAVLFGLATPRQSEQIIEVFAERWSDLIGRMPLKICYPAMSGLEWRLMTGSDPKNVPWSYHNGGNWPVLLWPFVGAAIKVNRPDLAQRAFDIAHQRLHQNHWPEYFDGKNGRLIGRRSNFYQTWSATAYILAHRFIEHPDTLQRLGWAQNDVEEQQR